MAFTKQVGKFMIEVQKSSSGLWYTETTKGDCRYDFVSVTKVVAEKNPLFKGLTALSIIVYRYKIMIAKV